MNVAVVVLGSVAVASTLTVLLKRPWTLRLARRHTPPEAWSTPLFLETNMVLSAAWSVLLIVAALLAAGAPLWVNVTWGIALAVLGRLSPRFAATYAARRRGAPPEHPS